MSFDKELKQRLALLTSEAEEKAAAAAKEQEFKDARRQPTKPVKWEKPRSAEARAQRAAKLAAKIAATQNGH